MHRHLTLTRSLTLAAAVALLSGCGASAAPAASESSESRTINGTLVLKGGEYPTTRSTCRGSGGYSDIHSGAQVKVTNEAGFIVGTGFLGDGQPGEDILNMDFAVNCTFPVTIPVVDEAKFYTITVGNRGGMTYSASDLEALGYEIALSLGTYA